jgi:uncharacterized protein YqiB (DUF1249 family)
VNYVVENSLGLYESNYAKLTALLPDLSREQSRYIAAAAGLAPIYVEVVERNPYTTTIHLHQGLAAGQAWIRDLRMKVRIYHDARVAEVLSYQGVQALQRFYTYPNPKMLQPYEKRRVNQFLGEWLSHCLTRRYLSAR